MASHETSIIKEQIWNGSGQGKTRVWTQSQLYSLLALLSKSFNLKLKVNVPYSWIVILAPPFSHE